MTFTKKPSGPPTFDAAAFTRALTSGKPVPSRLATQYIAWKQWVESTNAYDGADKGGLRDVLNADALAVDSLKVHLDTLDTREAAHNATQAQRLTALEAAVAGGPFPA